MRSDEFMEQWRDLPKGSDIHAQLLGETHPVRERVMELLCRDRADQIVAEHRAASNPSPPVDIGTLAEVLARPPEPPARVEDLLNSGGSLLVVAQRKTGKTTWCLNLARCLLTGERFLGRFEVRPVAAGSTVALLNFEVTAAQIARWADDADVPHDGLLLVNLRGSRNLLATGAGRAELVELLRLYKAEVLIVDPFGRAFGGNQNDAAEVGQWLVGLDLLATEAGVQELVLTAHAGWNAEHVRGSSALEGWSDGNVWLTRDEDGKQRFMSAEGRAGRVDEDGLEFDPDTRRLSLTGSGNRAATAAAQKMDRLIVALVDVVNGAPGINLSGITRAWSDQGVQHRNGDAGRASREAERRGLVKIEIGARGAREHHPSHLSPPFPTFPWEGSNPPIPPFPPPFRGGGVVVVDEEAVLEASRDPSPMPPMREGSPNGSAPYSAQPHLEGP